MKNFSFKALACAVVFLAIAETVNAISLNPFKREGRTRADTLLITGNFLDPRLIVELAQHRTKQPILLLSPDGFGNQTLYFMAAGTKPMTEASENFDAILKLINPRQIVILGNTDYVPAQYFDIAQKLYPVIVLTNEDWNANCQMLADILKQPTLPKMYIEYKARMQAAQAAGKDID